MTEKAEKKGVAAETPTAISNDAPGGGRIPQGIGRRAFKKKPIVRQPKFEGSSEDLKGHVYDCSNSRQADMFSKTTKAIAGHVGKKYQYGNDVRLAIQNLTRTVMDIPKDLAHDATDAAKRIWEKKIDEFVKRELYFDENMQTLCSLIWGQCSDVIHARVEASSDYDKMSESGDSLALLKAIKAQAHNFQCQKNKANALHDAKRRLLMIYQDRHTTCPVYLDRFQNCVDVLEHCGGAIGPDPALVKQILARSDNTTATRRDGRAERSKGGGHRGIPRDGIHTGGGPQPVWKTA
jgi:hypothetical protein